jgi:uncharacterized protein (DUF58 family)
LEVIAPVDAMVGRSDPLRVSVARPVGRSLIRASSISGAPWVRVDAPESGVLEVVPDQRGVFVAAEFELMVRAPLGLVAVTRRVLVHLADPVCVAPSPEPMARLMLAPLAVDPERSGTRSDDLPRGIREYVPGDPRRLVNWRARPLSGHRVTSHRRCRSGARARSWRRAGRLESDGCLRRSS